MDQRHSSNGLVRLIFAYTCKRISAHCIKVKRSRYSSRHVVTLRRAHAHHPTTSTMTRTLDLMSSYRMAERRHHRQSPSSHSTMAELLHLGVSLPERYLTTYISESNQHEILAFHLQLSRRSIGS